MKKALHVMLTVFVFSSTLIGCQAVETSDLYMSLLDEKRRIESELVDAQASLSKLADDYANISKELEETQNELNQVITDNESISFELDEILNGASRTIEKIRASYEEGKEDDVISLAHYLNDKFKGSAEDIEAQGFVEKIEQDREQRKIEKEEADRIATEEASKSAQQKARDIIKITKLSKSSANSVGGVDLFIGFTNQSDNIVKYATFSVQALNSVGDPAECRIRNYSIIRANDEGPYKKGEGLKGNYNWYWENAWYNYNIQKLVLLSVDIEYMDGSKVTISGKDFDYEW